MRKMLVWAAVVGAALSFGTGCDDGGSGGSGGTGGSGGEGGSGAAGGGGSGGAGGSGGDTGTTTSASEKTVNGCAPSAAEDLTAETSVTITQTGLTYDPACIKIKTGTSVTFSSTFASHPLVGGEVVNGTKTPDASSPITTTNTGTEATFTFPNAGTFGYYCDIHAASGMSGAIIVE